MNFWNSLAGALQVQFTAADLPGAFSAIEKAGIDLLKVIYRDALSVEFTIFRHDLKPLILLCEKKGYSYHVDRRMGIFWALAGLWKRPVLIIGIFLLLLLSLWAPERIFFVYTEGNSAVPTNLIMEKASQCGVSFGASRADVRSEKIKNSLMQEIPQLQWAGVNTYGCVAVISVTEREVRNETQSDDGVCSIISSVNAVVREMTVTEGTALCKIGDAVKTGEILISGYTDCGLTIRAGRAKGEIYGETMRELSAVMPLSCVERIKISHSIKNYSLIIGKKRINFRNNSGILDKECVRIYLENYVTLPGGFRLPVIIAEEAYIVYETEEISVETPDAVLQPYMEHLLGQKMQSGIILAKWLRASNEDALYRLDGLYNCYEMIGILRPEESLPEHENN